MTGCLNIHVPPPGICHYCFLVRDDLLNNYTKVYSVFIVFSTHMNTVIAVWLFFGIAFSFFRVLSYSLISPTEYHHLCKTNLICLWNLHSSYAKWCLCIVAPAAELNMTFLSFPSPAFCKVGDSQLLSCSVLPQYISYWTKQFSHNNQGLTHLHQECNSYAVLFIGRYHPAAWTSTNQSKTSFSLICCLFSSNFPSYTYVFFPP
jgi:hypothetical protein